MYILYKEAGYFTGLPLEVLCTVHGRAIARVQNETSNFLKGNIRVLDEEKVKKGHFYIGKFEKKVYIDVETGEEVYKDKVQTADMFETDSRNQGQKDSTGDGEYHDIVVRKVPLDADEKAAAIYLEKEAIAANIEDVFHDQFHGTGCARPELEASTFATQLDEARAHEADSNASTPMLSTIAENRGISVAELAGKVIAKDTAYKEKVGGILGRQAKYMQELKACDTMHKIAKFNEDYFGVQMPQLVAQSYGLSRAGDAARNPAPNRFITIVDPPIDLTKSFE
jgi:hypothetical protein